MTVTKIGSGQVKALLKSLGADLCGIADVERFGEAPEGYHPRDVMPGCRSVIVFACRFPVGALLCSSHAPYTRVRNSITAKMDAIALDFCIEAERREMVCAPIPTNEAKYDPRTGRSRCIISLKHAAQAAGLPCIISDKVPPECILTEGLVDVMTLSASPETWAEKILAKRAIPRTDRRAEIAAHGFDITTEAVKLQEFYLRAVQGDA